MNLFAALQHEFSRRHIGPNESQTQEMLAAIGVDSLDALIDKTIPSAIRLPKPLNIPPALSEQDYLRMLKQVSIKNKVFKTYIGQGYYDTVTPSVILRNVFENPG
jgi:glycine dehydrogenase (decarboxylating) alpha subunit (EC 1.4.4.2)/glycine dehydrogenase (decarboxylating) beta subunit (EC 1.4.4.2)